MSPLYLRLFLVTLLRRFDSNPTVSSSIYKHCCGIDSKRLGHNSSPVSSEGEVNPGMYAYRLVARTPNKELAVCSSEIFLRHNFYS